MKPLFFVLWGVGLLAVVVFSLIPQFVEIRNNSDKVHHVVVFSLLVLIPALVLKDRRYVYGLSLALMALGLGIEVAQGMTPGRSTSWEDAAADGVGILMGLFIGYLMRSGYHAAGR